jgi:DNA-binding LacI/PurR family transcriptional regulator
MPRRRRIARADADRFLANALTCQSWRATLIEDFHAGEQPPQDMSVVGFDDIPESPFFEPPLTTVRQDFSALGERGIDYLVERIQHPDLPVEQQVIYPELILRASTAPPKK